MVRVVLFSVFLFLFHFSQGQNIDAERLTAWNHAGLTIDIQAPENQVSILDFGADNTGVNSSSSAYNAAIASLNGSPATLFFPEGEYFLTSTIAVPSGVFLKGELTETLLRFDLGGSGNLIQLNGSTNPTETALTSNGQKGAYTLNVSDASLLNIGNIIRLSMYDEDLMFSSWAYGTLGQVVEIVEINGTTLTLADPLNHHYPLSRNPVVKKLNPIRDAGIECMKISRLDDSEAQVSNIYINAGFNCVVRNVESVRCDFGHVEINNSAHIQVERSYFHHGIGYGGGGRAYGVIFQTASSYCLAQENIFEHLRHSMLIQSGANGNVFGYNYSTDPFWESGSLPTNSAGDAVLHGNYPYLNLFEGNTVQFMVSDASHGSNGPFNTYFRNRAELYGFFTDSNTPTDSLNVIGNEMTNPTFPFGMFLLNGDGHLSHGNNVGGTTTPTGTETISDETLYLNQSDLPLFLADETLPMIGYPIPLGDKKIPAETRFSNSDPISCDPGIVTSTDAFQTEERTRKMWETDGLLYLNTEFLPVKLSFYS